MAVAKRNDWARTVAATFFRWSNGLECAGAIEAGDFEDWYQRISAPLDAGDPAAVDVAFDCLSEVLAWLRDEADRSEFAALMDAFLAEAA